jgi:hypothetical protein
VREAAWGNGPVDDTGTAPQADFTVPVPPRIPKPPAIRPIDPAPTGMPRSEFQHLVAVSEPYWDAM